MTVSIRLFLKSQHELEAATARLLQAERELAEAKKNRDVWVKRNAAYCLALAEETAFDLPPADEAFA